MVWLLRLSLVSLAAAAMSLVGFALLPDFSFGRKEAAMAASVSVVLWLCLTPLVYRQSLGTAVTVGLLSPLIVIALGSPVAMLALFFDIRYWLIFPTGALTGVLVWLCLSIGPASGRAKPTHAPEP